MTEFVGFVDNELNERGWSYSELARRINISRSYVSDIQNEKIKPSWDYVRKVARVLSIPEERALEMATLLDKGSTASPLYRELTEEAKDMADEDLVLLIDMARALKERKKKVNGE
jgi:transcriptional regulator with XRE-family HTH domain